jgi:hypothetical protein
MRPIFAAPVLLMGFAVCSQAIISTDVFTPVTPQQFVINFGMTTMSDGTQLPPFTLSFLFGYALVPSNYPTPFTFQMDNSSINPNTSSTFSPPAFSGISAPTLTSTGNKTSWTFDASNSSLRLSSTDVLFTIQYDPMSFDVIFFLDPNWPLPTFPTPEVVTESDNKGGGSPGTASGNLEVAPEPATLGMLAAGLALLAGESYRRRKRA